MKTSYTGKTIFVSRHCMDEVEKLIAKRRRQHLMESLDHNRSIFKEKHDEITD